METILWTLIAFFAGFIAGLIFGGRIRTWIVKLFTYQLPLLVLLLPLIGGCSTLQNSPIKVQAFTTEQTINCYEGVAGKYLLRSKSFLNLKTNEMIPAEVETEKLKTIESIGGKK